MKHFLAPTLLFISSVAFSQSSTWCGTPQVEKNIRANNPQILIDEVALQNFVKEWIAANKSEVRGGDPDYIIPVVFHIVHDYGSENISDDQVRDAMRIINEDYRKANADTTVIVSQFKSIATDAKVEFRLAGQTPDGVCTNGIDHIHSLLTYQGGDDAKLDYWPRNMYLNVWTVKQFGSDLQGVAGYAYLPSDVGSAANAPYDGVIILSNYVGSIGSGSPTLSRALTHEVGHVFGLPHPWGGTNSPGIECGDDGIDDTPETMGWTTCNLGGNVCVPGVIENVQNYMDYSYCSRMFTIGQGDEMHGVLNYSQAGRNNLWKAANLAATGTTDTIVPLCAPQVDFYSNYKMACTGTNVFFHDVSWGGEADSRTWTFQDGNPATATTKDPTVSFSTPGWKSVTLSATNVQGTSTVTRNQYLYISDNSVAQYPVAYWEDFENAGTFTADWLVQNPEGNSSTFSRVSNAGYYSSSCVELNNYHNMTGDIDRLITPSFNLSSGGTLYLDFRYTCANNTNVVANINDALTVWSSSNCGQTWILRSTIKTTELANAGYSSSAYTPNANSPWVGKSIILPSSLFLPNVRFKFEYKGNGHGNNFFIDNIQISSNPVGINDPDAASFVMNVFPNPLDENSKVVMHQQLSGNMNVRVVDIAGRTVKVIYDGWLAEGEHTFDLRSTNFDAAGMYFLIADNGITILREKVVVQ